jgi:hypothetical protein
MSILTARFKLRKESVANFEVTRDKILSALAEEQPKGIRYTWCKLSDGVTFLGLLELDEGVKNPLPDMPAGKEFLENIKNWVVEPPIREELSVVGVYQSVDKVPSSGSARRS